MSRVQLALNVEDIESSVAFYESLFNTQPHKRRTGYANFEIANPPLKLVLVEVPPSERGTGVDGALNHLGIEMDDTSEVVAQTKRLAAAGLNPFVQEQTNCCHAVQDKAWIADPAGTPWEVYTVTDDNPEGDYESRVVDSCCIPGQAGIELSIEAVEPSGTADSSCGRDESGDCCRDESGSSVRAAEPCCAGSSPS